MPKRTDLKTILIIGAGPIVIGQACEFDYSGAQACKAQLTIRSSRARFAVSDVAESHRAGRLNSGVRAQST